jgi:formate C-acetyltransferase
MATAYGKKAHEVLAGNFSPTPGTDKEGATAIIKSYCKADLRRTVSGAALDIKLLPSAVNGENGTEAIISLIKGFVTLGGHFMQLDIADTQLLKEAQKHPEQHKNLRVRVSGFSANFVNLNEHLQRDVMDRTEKKY